MSPSLSTRLSFAAALTLILGATACEFQARLHIVRGRRTTLARATSEPKPRSETHEIARRHTAASIWWSHVGLGLAAIGFGCWVACWAVASLPREAGLLGVLLVCFAFYAILTMIAA